MRILNQKGQGLTEYAILMVLVVMASVAIVKSIGTQLKIKLTKVREDIRREVTVD
jgi:Flp pilus assembly pilin Flp